MTAEMTPESAIIAKLITRAGETKDPSLIKEYLEAANKITTLIKENKESKRAAWDEAIEYVKSEIMRQHDDAVKRIGIPLKELTNKQIQPCFDAINATGAMTYSQYNAHIASVQLWGMYDWFIVRPEISDGEGGVFEADIDPNPYQKL